MKKFRITLTEAEMDDVLNDLIEDYAKFTDEDIRTHVPEPGRYEDTVYHMKGVYEATQNAEVVEE